MKYLWIFLVSIGLFGCATAPQKPDAIITEKIVHVDPRALIPCEPLQVVTEPTFDAVIATTVTNAEIYMDCRNKQDASIKLLKEFANIKDKP